MRITNNIRITPLNNFALLQSSYWPLDIKKYGHLLRIIIGNKQFRYLCQQNNHFMMKSMTGFGKHIIRTDEKDISIEIRTLNSKQLDIYIKMPQVYREKELEVRALLSNILQRGKTEVTMSINQKSANLQPIINLPVAQHYFKQLNSLSNTLQQNTTLNDLLPVLVKLPDVLSSKEEEINPEEWAEILKGLELTCLKVDDFRKQEGLTLTKDLEKRIRVILELLLKVETFENERINNIKERISSNLDTFLNEVQSDKNRLEQEMIYYIQKLDITEEKIRLKKHCEYFLETMSDESSPGKKLGFISQEIGREINTLGSKANEVNIQKIVVLMKDELEKIKEQLFNIL